MQLSAESSSGNELNNCLRALSPLLERHAQQRFGSSVVKAAWQSFGRWGVAAIAHEKEIYQSAFTAWWLFAWLPDDQDLKDERFLVPAPDHAIATDYLTVHRNNLSPLEQRVIKRAVKSPHSFYNLLSIETDNRLRLQEIYTQKQVIVEGVARNSYALGDVIFGAVLSVDGMSILLGCMPQALGLYAKARIESHRAKWRSEVGKAIDQRLLYLHDSELRRFYFLLLNWKQQEKLH